MKEDLEETLKEQVGIVKGLVDSLSLTPEQKKELKGYIHQKNFLITSLPLTEEQAEGLNNALKKAYEIYDRAYEQAKRCPAVSEWMTEPTTIIYNIWNSINK